MADATILYSVDNSQDYNVVVQTQNCKRIFVQENYSSSVPPTQDLLQKMPASATNAISITKGTPAIYTPSSGGVGWSNNVFYQGQIVGTIRTAAGSVTVQQIESTEI